MAGELQPPTVDGALRELAAEVGVKYETLHGVWQEKAHMHEYMAGVPRDDAEVKAFNAVATTYRKRLR